MHRFGIIGTVFRRVGTRGLERFTVPNDERAERLPRLREALEVDELIYLATCNRVEILVTGHDLADPALAAHRRRRAFAELVGREPAAGEAERALRLWGGEGALEHLLVVSCGLDSAQLGEREIRGQLRAGHALARELDLCGPLLDWAVERAIRAARDVEKASALAKGRLSLAGIGLARLQEHLVDRPGRVALVGVSAMTERCGEALRADGVDCTVVNRGAERGRALADRLGVPYRPLDAFLADPGPFTALVVATGARRPIFDADALETLCAATDRPPLVVDFGVPPDVDPRAAERLGVTRWGMDEINAEADANRERRRAESATAREHVDRALADLRREMAERSTSPVLAELDRRYRRTARDGASRLFRRELRHLGESERKAVESFALGLAKRFAHVPLRGLRALASEHGSTAVDTFLAASDAELAKLLRSEPGAASDAETDAEATIEEIA